MNDYLTTLIQTRADELEIPRPDVAGLVSRGRRRQTRRRIAGGIAAASVVGLMATSAAVLPGLTTSDSGYSASAATEAYLNGGAFAVGSTLYFGNSDDYAVKLDDPIRTIAYSKSGVVVSTGKDKWSDGDGDSRFWLVTTTGDVTPLSIDGQRNVSVDFDSSYVAYSAKIDGENQIVVLDAASDEEVGRANLGMPGKYGDTSPPEVSISDGKVYFSRIKDNGQGEYVAFDWASGEIDLVTSLDGRSPHIVRAGLAVGDPLFGEDGFVRDIVTGKKLLTVPDPGIGNNGEKYAGIQLSANGRTVLVWNGDQSGEPQGGVAHDLETGAEAKFTAPPTEEFNWTPDGDFIYVEGGMIKVCDPFTSKCDTEPLPKGAKPVLGG
jgi:hypothetical protein